MSEKRHVEPPVVEPPTMTKQELRTALDALYSAVDAYEVLCVAYPARTADFEVVRQALIRDAKWLRGKSTN